MDWLLRVKRGGGKAEPKGGLRGGAFCQHDPVRHPPGQFDDPPFARTQAVIFTETETLAYPVGNDVHGGPYQHSLHPGEGAWKGRRFTHDLEEFAYDGGWLQSAPHRIEHTPPLPLRSLGASPPPNPAHPPPLPH